MAQITSSLGPLLQAMCKPNIRREVFRQFPCVTVAHDDTLQAAFKKLTEHGILGAPVLTFGRYTGFIDMMDLCSFVATQIVPVPTDMQRELKKLFGLLKKTTVKQIKHKPKFLETHPDSSLFHGFENLARHRLHRMVVLDHDPTKVLGVFTQSMVVRWIASKMDLLGSLRRIPVSTLRPYSAVASVNENTTAMAAFDIMTKNNFSAVAIVNENGSLVDCLSVRDLRGIDPSSESFARLWGTVKSFKSNVRVVDQSLQSTTAPWTPRVVMQTDSLDTVMRIMDTCRVHRVFVVDTLKSMKPLDCITMTDVLSFILKHAAPAKVGPDGRPPWRY